MAIGIYIIEHVSGKLYVGQSIDVEARLKSHRYHLDAGDHHCIYLQRAWKKYGSSQFAFKQIISCDRDQLDYHENMLFSEHGRSLYNVHLSSKPRYIRGETRLKVSAALKGRTIGPMMEQTKKKISAALSKQTIEASNGISKYRFSSMASAAEALGVSKQTVWNCLNGRQSQSKGWSFIKCG